MHVGVLITTFACFFDVPLVCDQIDHRLQQVADNLSYEESDDDAFDKPICGLTALNTLVTLTPLTGVITHNLFQLRCESKQNHTEDADHHKLRQVCTKDPY